MSAGYFVLCAALLLISFILYHLPAAAVAYPVCLCLAVGAGVLTAQFLRELRRHRALTALQSRQLELSDHLPPAGSIEGEDYQILLELLREQQKASAQRAAADYQHMMDYYTLWAHQIKTPMASMRLRLQNEDTALSRQLLLDLGRIEQYADMVLTYLRLDSESTDYTIRTFPLDPLLRAAVRKFSGEFIDRKLQLSFQATETSVLSDEKWLGFVIEQVLSNALKYTRSGGTVSISLEAPKTLCIADTGIGIAPEDLPRIFERGYTGYTGRSSRQASGIGLYLCRRICKNLGHTITARSEVGVGTVVSIDLARARLEVE